MERLTPKEEEIMQILWQIGNGFVKDVIGKMPDPKPQYTTVSTMIRILEQKGFVAYKAYGKTHEYFPKITKWEYQKFVFQGMLKNYFGGSPKQVVSYLVAEENLSDSEIQDLKDLIDKHLDHKDENQKS